jgi:hypothetical protein
MPPPGKEQILNRVRIGSVDDSWQSDLEAVSTTSELSQKQNNDRSCED